jgi:hypothetical protein
MLKNFHTFKFLAPTYQIRIFMQKHTNQKKALAKVPAIRPQDKIVYGRVPSRLRTSSLIKPHTYKQMEVTHKANNRNYLPSKLMGEKAITNNTANLNT